MLRSNTLLAAAIVACSTTAAMGQPRHTGPWNLQELAEVPEVEWLPAEGNIKPLYYSGMEFRGRPTRVFAYYAAPPRSDGQKVPAMVLVHGGGGAAFKQWAELWADRGYAAIAMDLAGAGPDRQPLADGGPGQDDAEKFGAIEQGVEAAWPYHAVGNVIKAVSLLSSLEEVDAKRVGITGISWGGYLTCIVAGLDERLQVAVPVYGCGFLGDNSAWVERLAAMPAESRQLWLDTFDPSRYLAGCRMPMLFVNGTNDFAYPLDSYQKSYRLVQGPRTLCVTVRMPHSHPDGWAPSEIGIFVDSVLGEGLSLATLDEPALEDRSITARYESVVPIVKAELHFTLDEGSWNDRNWQSAPAEFNAGRVTAERTGEEPSAWFLTITDERGAVVSTPHVAK